LLGVVRPAPRSEDKREGRKNLVLDLPSWARRSTSWASARRRRAVAWWRSAMTGERWSGQQERARADLAALNQGGFSSPPPLIVV